MSWTVAAVRMRLHAAAEVPHAVSPMVLGARECPDV